MKVSYFFNKKNYTKKNISTFDKSVSSYGWILKLTCTQSLKSLINKYLLTRVFDSSTAVTWLQWYVVIEAALIIFQTVQLNLREIYLFHFLSKHTQGSADFHSDQY